MSIRSSDYSNSKRSTNVAAGRLYSDFDMSMTLHPVKKDITPLTDLQAVRNAVKNLVLTNFSERPFQSKLGSNVTALLFNPADQFTAIQMKKEIYRLLEDHEPRVNATKVQILDDTDANAYRVSINFNVVQANTQTGVEFALQRLR
jgi:phage baseplate assembly protein W